MEDACTWPVDTSVCLADDSDNPNLRREAIDAAVGVLWALTGRQFGLCQSVARPATASADDCAYVDSPWMVPLLLSGRWYNTACRHRPTPAGNAVLLPGPVHSITGVAIDGAKIDADSYRAEGDFLYRVDGEWPDQDMSKPLGEPGTWSVTYLRGVMPPAGAALGVGRLANEFMLSCTQPQKCALPRNTTQVQRQGVTVQMADPMSIINQGGTGLPEVDMWIRAHNPGRTVQPASVWSPDVGVL